MKKTVLDLYILFPIVIAYGILLFWFRAIVDDPKTIITMLYCLVGFILIHKLIGNWVVFGNPFKTYHPKFTQGDFVDYKGATCIVICSDYNITSRQVIYLINDSSDLVRKWISESEIEE